MKTREKQKQHSSNQILQASLHVFGQKGYYQTKYSDISKIANVTNGLIVQRFTSRDNLFSILVNDSIVDNFPSLNEINNIEEGLIKIINFVKNQARLNPDNIYFGLQTLNALNDIPQECTENLESLFKGSKFESFVLNQMKEDNILEEDSFRVFIKILKKCYSFTFEYMEKNLELPSDSNYLKMFNVQNDNHKNIKTNTEIDNLIFNNTSAATWLIELNENKEPRITLEDSILLKLGMHKGETPEKTYKYLFKYIIPSDKPIVHKAIEKMLNDETVELTFSWNGPTTNLIKVRCFGKRIKGINEIKIEGFFQKYENITFLKNERESALLVINAISPDYDSVLYIHVGKDSDEDFFDEYKKSDFLLESTNNLEGKRTFEDCLRLVLDKFVSAEERKKIRKTLTREIILKNLKANKIYSQKFKVQYYGGLYLYQLTFIADNDENNNLNGVICGIRMVKYEDNIKNTNTDIELIKNESERINTFNSLFVNNLYSAYLINLRNKSFEVIKRSDISAKRNRIVPDFSIYATQYANKDIYFEDRERVLQEINLETVKEKLDKNNGSYSFAFRQYINGKITYCKANVISAGRNLLALGIETIEKEITDENSIKENLESKIRELENEILQKNLTINNVNSSLTELIVDVASARMGALGKRSSNIRETTFTLAKQVMNDYPEYNLTNDKITKIGKAATLHDIGKIFIPESILYKKEKLTKKEYEIVKQHSLLSLELIEKLKPFYTSDYYEIAFDICKYHHERYDGKGYPEGLVGDQIPISAQIVSITDVFEALLTERIYKGPYTPEEAYNMIINGECGVFNPKLISSFKKCFGLLTNFAQNNSNEQIVLKIDDIYNPMQFEETINENSLPVIANLSEQMPCGFFVYKKEDNNILFFNDLMVQIFGCRNREEFVEYINNSFRNIVHPDDFDNVCSELDLQIKNTTQNRNSINYRIIRKDGSIRSIKNYAHLVHSIRYGDVFYVFLLEENDKPSSKESRVETNTTNVTNYSESKTKLLDKVRILLVDDNDLSRFMSQDMLELEGANVTSFNNATDALKNIEATNPFDIILLDLVMPEINGAELTSLIRQKEEDTDVRVPIVALTGESDSALACEALDNGADGIMGKPLNIPELGRLLIKSIKERSRKMENNLRTSIRHASIDALTHVKNAIAYEEAISTLSSKISKNPEYRFAVLFADINNLKIENDKYGHMIGDIYIKNCCKIICDTFAHSPVYRIGGDEFAIILENDDLDNSETLFKKFKEKIDMAKLIPDSQHGKASIAAGLVIYDKNKHNSVLDVVEEADKLMYIDKQAYHKK